MMSPSAIRYYSDLAAKEAAEAKKLPYVPFDVSEIDENRFKIPQLGSYCPKGWKMVEELFCDITGHGYETEPAMTLRALKEKMKEYLNKKGTYGYAITDSGQFQAYIGVFKKGRAR